MLHSGQARDFPDFDPLACLVIFDPSKKIFDTLRRRAETLEEGRLDAIILLSAHRLDPRGLHRCGAEERGTLVGLAGTRLFARQRLARPHLGRAATCR